MMLEKIAKLRSWLCRALRGSFDNLRYVDGYGESYFLLSMIAAVGFFGLLFYIMATHPVGLFPQMEPDVAACTQLKSDMPYLSCKPEKIEQFYQSRRKLSRLMRPAKTKEPNGWLVLLAGLLALVGGFFLQLFREAGYIEALNKRKRGVLPDPVKQWQKEAYGEPVRTLHAIEVAYNWTEKTLKRIKKPLLPAEDPEPEPESQVVEWVEAEFLAQLDRTMAQNVSKPSVSAGNKEPTFTVHNLADGAGGISKSKLTTILRELLDCTPIEYIVEYRMSRARQLLISGLPVWKVKVAVGYTKNSKSFCDVFWTHNEVTPGRYAKRRAHPQNNSIGGRPKKGGKCPNS